jgi:thiol-disulfide isomerase/thioredoxin
VTRGWRPPAGALALVAVLLGAGALGFLLHRLVRTPVVAVPARTAATAVPRAAAPPAAAHPIPEVLPDISLPDTQGMTHHLADWKGRALVINFWATWCEPCRREIPLLRDLRRENRGNGFEIVGIAIDHRESVAKYVREMRIGYPVLVGERGGLEAAQALGMEPILPFTVFADSQGRIVTLRVGELHRDEAAFILARLADIGTGRLSLSAARQQIDERVRRLAVSRAVTGSD